MTKIFLSYRSEEDAYAAVLLDEKLSEVVGRENVFRASRSVAPGESYAEAIMEALRLCDTVLVIIGRTWQGRIEENGDRASPDEDDWVRVEVATALRHGKRVIPLLLSRTSRLSAHDLPDDISELAFKQYLKFEHRTTDVDLALLLKALGLPTPLVGEPQPPPPASNPVPGFSIRREVGWDGNVEVDVVRRGRDGAVLGRLSGHAGTADLARMAAMIAQPLPGEVETGHDP
ncbi:toll/interleukin-1 receptor domain-containing protein [Saccharothrix xinjiangensis]|uniref:Toll/interleukin-1 receptor domain-containing protein n=1 Tax=Saccharothrix xinjiangensis TaxID=204798 RepID=A0ABV9XTG8_9PSEU